MLFNELTQIAVHCLFIYFIFYILLWARAQSTGKAAIAKNTSNSKLSRRIVNECIRVNYVVEASKLFVECLDDCFLTQHIDGPTRITSTSKTTLDLVITDQPDMIDEVEILDSQDNSDYLMLRWFTVVEMQLHEYRSIVKNYNKANYKSIRDQLR